MKKLSVLVLVSILGITNLFAQKNISVSIYDDVYEIIEQAQLKGLCSTISSAKPYTRAQITKAINEIYDSGYEMTEREAKILGFYVDKLRPNEEVKNNIFHAQVKNDNPELPLSFNYNFGFEMEGSIGLYNESDYNKSYLFELIPSFTFEGDLTKYFSYNVFAFFDGTKASLVEVGDYFIGYSWFGNSNYTSDELVDFLDGVEGARDLSQYKRKITKKLLTSYMPYKYNKRWDGQVYFISNLSASGLEGWPQELSVGGGIKGEINFSVLDDKLLVKFGRVDREWAGMDNGSSLVLNAQADPFFGLETSFVLFPWLRYSFMVGGLEYPNQDYIAENSWPEDSGSADDTYFFQNAFSINMIEVDFKYLHCDFGSTVVWPKRFELGYMFPLTNYVVYQNSVGDNDNLALFGDIRLQKAGLGQIWFSGYLEEVTALLKRNIFESTRAMFAYQAGLKFPIPKLSWASFALRYTKVEPYCYTHHSINYAPWYNHYIFENYTNAGSCIGYYMPPNSDELLAEFKFNIDPTLSAHINYQFSRHGADYGSQQVPGSNLYSEMSPYNRNELQKYFLHDGAYNWIHALTIGGKLRVQDRHCPIEITGDLGLVLSYYTVIDENDYNRDIAGNNGNCANAGWSTPYHIANSEEYPTTIGVVITVGCKFFFK
ncbi:hypothetical protein MSI_24720 [Treponema sp. JC4]|uniref:hypothetical protein n=1 Tax=Treponema sp. JC4 TaxID=1124982 RepID=UPI00025AFDC3|nr:hypothetical protein [Treponema sp. JC4]EID84087.1 hypothetical protein MSI_24720 [Treponema sp. JC4]